MAPRKFRRDILNAASPIHPFIACLKLSALCLLPYRKTADPAHGDSEPPFLQSTTVVVHLCERRSDGRPVVVAEEKASVDRVATSTSLFQHILGIILSPMDFFMAPLFFPMLALGRFCLKNVMGFALAFLAKWVLLAAAFWADQVDVIASAWSLGQVSASGTAPNRPYCDMYSARRVC
jgi:hypothetical protein